MLNSGSSLSSPAAEHTGPGARDDINGYGSEPLPAATTLFRAQAIEGLRSRQGRPVALFGLGSWVLAGFIFLIFVTVVAILCLSTFARKETVSGYIQPEKGSAAITFSRPGRVTEIFAREGDMVTKGQRLMKISLDTALEGETLGSRLARASDRQVAELDRQVLAAGSSDAAQQQETASRIAGARLQVTHLTDMLGLQRQRLALGQETLRGLETLRERGFVSEIRLRDKQAEVIALQQSITDTERQLDQSRSDIGTLQATANQARARALGATSQLRSSQAELEQRRAQTDAERDIILVAPYSGRLVTVRAVVGSALEVGAPLATVLPHDARLQAVLWVPSRAIGFVGSGDEVRLMFDAFPYQRFGTGRGVVQSISTTPVEARELPFEELAREGALYRVRVDLGSQAVNAYGKTWPLAPGSRLKADLILDRQSLLDWLLDPLQAFRKRAA